MSVSQVPLDIRGGGTDTGGMTQTTTTPTLTVGQKVILTDVNDRKDQKAPSTGTIIKVGRVLVTITNDRYSWDKGTVYRIESRSTNDIYEHGHFFTEAEWTDRVARREATARLRELGLSVTVMHPHSISTEALRGVVDLLEAQP